MSVLDSGPSTIAVQRQQVTQDAVGGIGGTWVTLDGLSAIRATIQTVPMPHRAQLNAQLPYDQRSSASMTSIYCAVDVSAAQPGDRVFDGERYYQVLTVRDMGGQGRAWCIESVLLQ